jgi:hypothetical protein
MTTRLTVATERAVWSLLRAALASGGYLARVANGVMGELRPPERIAPEHLRAQLALWTLPAPEARPVPWRVRPDFVFRCMALGCSGMSARTCVARQIVTDRQRTQQESRGQGTEFPTCDTRKCAQGRVVREALRDGLTVRGAGPGGRLRYDPQGKLAGKRMRQLEREGALGEVPTCDREPTEDDE